MSPKLKRQLINLITAFVLAVVIVLSARIVPDLPYRDTLETLFFFGLYLWVGWPVLKKAFRRIGYRDFMDENFLMAIASLGAFLLGEHTEAFAVMWFYQLGEWFQSYALGRSRRNIAELMDIRPDIVHIELDGKIVDEDPQKAAIGQVMVIYPGERVALDGEVVEGESSLDTSALTGESVPRAVRPGSELISGCINENGTLKAKITQSFEHSTVSRILELVENATNKKSRSEQFITRFARIYTPIVVGLAILLAIVPSLFTGEYQTWVYRALEFLVISCPCALVISVPLSFFAGIGAASKCGILFKGSTYLQKISEIKVLVCDKTGTLTKGVFEVTNLQSPLMDGADMLNLAARLEAGSTHPIARSIIKASGLKDLKVLNVEEIAGKGRIGVIDGQKAAIGNRSLMEMQEIAADSLPEVSGFVTPIYLSLDGKYAGCIEISDIPKDNVKTVLSLIKKDGVKEVVMLSGDKSSVAQALADQIGVDEVYGDLLPDQKVSTLEQVMKEHPGMITAFVGDGINDAPVLIRSDIGIAMGSLGSDAAIEAADVVLMNDQLDDLITAFRISRKCMHIVYFNIAFAIGIKVLFLILGALGFANMWMAVFADVGISFLCILNAMRIFRVQRFNVNRI